MAYGSFSAAGLAATCSNPLSCRIPRILAQTFTPNALFHENYRFVACPECRYKYVVARSPLPGVDFTPAPSASQENRMFSDLNGTSSGEEHVGMRVDRWGEFDKANRSAEES